MRYSTLALALSLIGCGSSSEAPNDDGTQSSVAGSDGTGTDPGAGGSATSGSGGSAVVAPGSGGSAGSNATGGGAGTAAHGTGGAGGTAGMGGGSSVDAGGPHVVMACPTVGGAPGKVGVWEKITPASIIAKGDTPGGAVLVNPKDTRIVYVGSANGTGLWKSTDCGATFVHINTGKNGSHIDSGRIWDMVIDPVDPEILYVIEGYGDGGLWKTTNGGVDWENTTPIGSEVAKTANGNFTSIVGMDITDHLHLVLAFHSGCGGAYAPNCQAETKDGGATWRLFKEPIAGEGVGVIVLTPRPGSPVGTTRCCRRPTAVRPGTRCRPPHRTGSSITLRAAPFTSARCRGS